MIQKNTQALDFFKLHLGIYHFLGLYSEDFCDGLIALGLAFECEIMVAGDDYFMFVRQGLEKMSKFLELFGSRHACEVAGVDENVRWREVLKIEVFVLVVGI
jgi:hypothetical protein